MRAPLIFEEKSTTNSPIAFASEIVDLEIIPILLSGESRDQKRNCWQVSVVKLRQLIGAMNYELAIYLLIESNRALREVTKGTYKLARKSMLYATVRSFWSNKSFQG